MGGLRDYQAWHKAYDDPHSSLSRRLQVVQEHLGRALDERPGPVRVLSLCSGDGRDLIGVLSRRDDVDRVHATLVEIHPRIAQQARDAAAAASLPNVRVLTADASGPDAYAGSVPADLVIMVGIFGNISVEDLARTIDAAGQFCAPGATLLWSRGREDNDDIRSWFARGGFTELAYTSLPADPDDRTRPAVGAVRYDGEPRPLVTGQPLFTFLR